MKIGVSGANGELGRAVVTELQLKLPAEQIVAITRSPDKVGPSVESRVGDYDRPETLAAAYAGLDRLLIIPSADLRPGARSRQGAAALDAAATAGVGHLFLLSATGTRKKSEPAMGAAYWAAEKQLLQSAFEKWTILRMNYFSETLVQEAQMAAATGILPGFGENRVAYVSRDDVARASAGALSTNHHEGAIYNLCGPSAVGGAERAELLSKASGKPLAFTVLAEEQLRGGLIAAGLPPFLVDALASMQQSFVDGAYDIVTGDVKKLSGHEPRALQDVLAGAFA